MSRLRILCPFAALSPPSRPSSPPAAAAAAKQRKDPQTVLEEATLEGIKSGDLDLSLGVDVERRGRRQRRRLLSGPFQSEKAAEPARTRHDREGEGLGSRAKTSTSKAA